MATQIIHLTKAQRDKLERGESIQFSRRQLDAPNEKEHYGAEFHMTDEGLDKLSHSMHTGKGIRLNPQFHYKGFGLLDDVKKFAKQNGGKAAEGVKKLVPKSTMESVIHNGLTAAGMSPETAAMIAATGTSAIYATDFSKPVGDQTGKILSTTVNTGFKTYKKNKAASAAATETLAVGSGFSSGQTPMQIKMAALRAMRKQKVGGSFKGGSFKGGAIKSSPTYLANHYGMNSQLFNQYKDDPRMPKKKGGSFKGGAMFNFSPQSNSIIDNGKLKDTLAKYEGGKLFKFDPKSYYT